MPDDTTSTRAAELRAQFDGEFAAAPPPPAPPMVDLLRVRIGTHALALVLDDIVAVHADLRVVPLPSVSRALRGVVAIRGQVIPIYDLGLALGWEPVAAAARWIVTARARPIGFAIDHSDGHARVPLSSLAAHNVVALASVFEEL